MALYQFIFCSVLIINIILMPANGANAVFGQNYSPLWGENHLTLVNQGTEVQLSLDKASGSGFRSKLQFGSGLFRIRMKLPEQKTGGFITSFYLTSAQDFKPAGAHDELDFEFLGTTGILQTNVFVNDGGNREQRFKLWFDPSKDFHAYEILWNQYQVAWFVDGIPIRVFKNNKARGVNYVSKPMQIEASIFSADWAGQIDWSLAPFVAHYQDFDITGCPSSNTIRGLCSSPQEFWNAQRELSLVQKQQLHRIRKTYMTYDYCNKSSNTHPECSIS